MFHTKHRSGQNIGMFFTMLALVGLLLTTFAVSRQTALAGSDPGKSAANNAQSLSNGKQVLGYFTEWGIYGRNYHVKNLVSSGTAARMTTLLYAFSNVMTDTANSTLYNCAIGDPDSDYNNSFGPANTVDGKDDAAYAGAVKGNFYQLQLLKNLYPDLHVVISIGGWSWSSLFSKMAANATSRQHFVDSCLDMYIDGNFASGKVAPGIFDGIDVDWEYPGAAGLTNDYSAQDPANFVALLAEFRSQLNARGAANGHYYSLHIASGAGADSFGPETSVLSSVASYVDSIDLMAYDMHGAFDTGQPTNFQAPLYGSAADPTTGSHHNYNVNYAVSAYINAGVPRNKLIMGVPFYGRGWTNVPNVNNGLYQYQASMAPANGTWDEPGKPSGVDDYHLLKTLTNGGGYQMYRDDTTKSLWIFNGTTFWSYDDPTTIGYKTDYIKNQNLGGAMFWDATGDDAQGTLISAIYDGLSNPPTAGGCGSYSVQGNNSNTGNCSTIISTNGGSTNGGWQFTQNMTGAIGIRSTSASGTALYGLSTSGIGVQGSSSSTYGVRASSSSSYGLLATSVNSVGVRGTSQTYYGFYAGSTSGVGGYASTSSGSAAFWAHNNTPNTAGHYGIISDGDVLVNGNLSCTGNCNAAMSVKTDAGEKMVYAESATQNYISDQGTATLKGGHAVIKIDPTFAKTVNLSKSYMVMVVPNSADTAGLAVINKQGDSFEVVELAKGAGNFSFDYRITGIRKGYESVRLADAPAAVQLPAAPKDDPQP